MRRTPLSVLLVPLALAGCARSGVDSPGGPAAALPSDRTFVATAAAQGGAPKQLAKGSRIELRFQPDGRLSASSGCNTLGGIARLDGGRLMVDQLSATEKACDEALTQQESWLTDLLAAGPSWNLAGTELTLRAGGSELRLTDRSIADRDRSLTGTRWVFSTIVKGTNASSMPPGVDAFLTIAADGSVTGRAGCNHMGGTATIDGATLRLSNVVTTRMACEGPAGEFERTMLAVFAQPLNYKIDSGRLTVTAPDGAGYELVAAA